MRGLVDCHVHSKFSKDACGNIEELCRRALDLGLNAICITDHFTFWEGDKNFPPFDYDAYKNEVDRCRSIFGNRLMLLMGVEVDYHPEHEVLIAEYLSNKSFDYVLGSLHYLNGYSLLEGKCFEQFGDVQSVILRYIEVLMEMVASGLFDAIAHLDWIKRGWYKYVGPTNADNCLLEYASKELRELFKLMKRKGTGIELNTKGFRVETGRPFPNRTILKLYREEGGRVITLGSDAHHPGEVAQGIDKCFREAASVGFREIVFFKSRRPHSFTLAELT